MTVLGVDYGRVKIGVALGEEGLARPLLVLRVSSRGKALERLKNLADLHAARKIVVGISEGEMAQEQMGFAEELKDYTNKEVITWDETLTTQDAKELAITAGIPQKRRRLMEDAIAAAVMLQSFLDGEATEGSNRV